jgi:hypothetical protein
MMHGPEKSDPVIVAMKPANKAEGPPAARPAEEKHATESAERRAGTKGNADQRSTYRTQSRTGRTQCRPSVSQALERTWDESIAGKWLQLLAEIAPRVKRAAVMFNPDAARGGLRAFGAPLEAAARALKVEQFRTATIAAAGFAIAPDARREQRESYPP